MRTSDLDRAILGEWCQGVDFATTRWWALVYLQDSQEIDWKELSFEIAENDQRMVAAAVAPTPVKIAFDLADIQVDPPVSSNGLRNYRCKRQDSILGWFDRWNFFEDAIEHPQSIASLPDETQRTACRRRLVRGIAVHVSVVTGLVCVLVFVGPIADALKRTSLGSYQGHGHKLGLTVGTVLELLVLKLVFDIPTLRVLAFSSYTITVTLLFASTTLAFHGSYAVLCLGLAASDWWLRWWLYGVRIRGSLLSTATIAGISFVVVSGVLISLLATAADGNSQLLLALGVTFESANAILGTIELSRLLDTLTTPEASDGVYFLNLDLLIGGVFVPALYIYWLCACIYHHHRILVAVEGGLVAWMPWWTSRPHLPWHLPEGYP